MNAGIFPGQILTADLRKSILEGHLSSLQLPRLALNSFLSVPQEHQGQASSAPVGRSPRKTQAPGAACQNQTGGLGAPPPTQGDRASPKSVLQKPSTGPSQGSKQCLLKFSRKSPEDGGRGHPHVPAFHPFFYGTGLWRHFSQFPSKFPRNT